LAMLLDMVTGIGIFRHQLLQVLADLLFNPFFPATAADQRRDVIDLKQFFLNDNFVGDGGFHESGAAFSAMCWAHRKD
jgi:hypothetical protein